MESKKVRKVIKLLERSVYCRERAIAADDRSRRHPGTLTGDREQAVADRWFDKAEAAWEEAMSILRPMAGMAG